MIQLFLTLIEKPIDPKFAVNDIFYQRLKSGSGDA